MKDQADVGHLRQALEPLLNSPQDRAQMAEKAESLGRPDAASRLVDLLLDTGLG
jgi:UDP-N-acetylglucosamine--N-acetylmuramyl-(pentapeptide) pyrophosphoryl-undecaprenol N-acetylglucosamine transferase